jgi:hypothetical protein
MTGDVRIPSPRSLKRRKSTAQGDGAAAAPSDQVQAQVELTESDATSDFTRAEALTVDEAAAPDPDSGPHGAD